MKLKVDILMLVNNATRGMIFLLLPLFILQGKLNGSENYEDLPIGRIHLYQIYGTNLEYAIKNASRLLKDPESWVVITSDHQLEAEICEPEDLTIPGVYEPSFILMCPWDKICSESQIKQMAAFAIAKVLNGLHFENVQISWPNKVLINEKEVAKIFCDVSWAKVRDYDYVSFGIRLNINISADDMEEEFDSKEITSMRNEHSEYFDEEEILTCLTQELKFVFDSYFKNDFQSYIYPDIEKLYAFKGQEINVKLPSDSIITGELVTIDKDDRLILKMKDSRIWIIQGGRILKGMYGEDDDQIDFD